MELTGGWRRSPTCNESELGAKPVDVIPSQRVGAKIWWVHTCCWGFHGAERCASVSSAPNQGSIAGWSISAANPFSIFAPFDGGNCALRVGWGWIESIWLLEPSPLQALVKKDETHFCSQSEIASGISAFSLHFRT
uniref:Uncharacterized protein n=1 Tax=Sphaerodactylus townsendi TaxID=933632 RepID=A0ACB8GCM8_9SAUR